MIRAMTIAGTLLLAIGLAPAGPAAAAAPALPALDPQALQATLGTLPTGEASGVLAQIRGKAGNWQGTAGVADIHTGAAVPQNGRFRIGSMTKAFTATVALQLVAERRLDLGRTVQHYLPGLLPADPPVTVRQVLQYTSGINGVGYPHKTPAWYFENRFRDFPPGSQLDTDAPLAFKPGTAQRYGNADYIVAGLLIEKVTGRSWASEVNRRIIKPLRLCATSTPAPHDVEIRGPHARGYEKTAEGWVDITAANTSLQWSAASMISDAADLDRFLVALLSGRLLPKKQLALMLNPPNVPVFDGDEDPANDKPAEHGAGLTRYEFGSTVLYGKSGDRPGYANGMGATADLSRRLVFSVNTIHMGGDQPKIAQRIIAAAFLG
jgi:D-alanyl-D-alanine carboxypeptidase